MIELPVVFQEFSSKENLCIILQVHDPRGCHRKNILNTLLGLILDDAFSVVGAWLFAHNLKILLVSWHEVVEFQKKWVQNFEYWLDVASAMLLCLIP